MNSRSTHLTGFPSPAFVDEYEHAAAEMEARLQELPGLVAVYRTGTVAVPGISDLDRIAVVDRDAVLPSVWEQLRPRTRYLAMHTPFALDFETFVRHRWFARLEPLEIVWGAAIPLDRPPASEEGEQLLGTEGLVVTWLKLKKQSATGRAKVRPLLCELNNVRRNLRLARLTPEDAASAWQLATDVTRAREQWWLLTESERVDAVRGIEAQAPRAIGKALAAIAFRLPAELTSEEIRLRGLWSNVTLRGGRDVHDHSFYVIPRVLSRASMKMAEGRWRFARHSICLPSQLVSLLNGTFASSSFRKNRRDVVRRYVEFMRERANDYSSVGHAGIFAA
jgi:hypothetical protein